MAIILITGGKGDLAQSIKKYLTEYEVLDPSKDELDVADKQAMKSYIEKHKPDILINCAGIMPKEDLVEAERWEEVIQTNLIGTYYGCKYALENNCKKIINIASTAGLYGNAGFSAYSASKAGIILMTQCLALEGVKAYCIAPARFHSALRAKTFPRETEIALMETDIVAKTVFDVLEGTYPPAKTIEITGKPVVIRKYL